MPYSRLARSCPWTSTARYKTGGATGAKYKHGRATSRGSSRLDQPTWDVPVTFCVPCGIARLDYCTVVVVRCCILSWAGGGATALPRAVPATVGVVVVVGVILTGCSAPSECLLPHHLTSPECGPNLPSCPQHRTAFCSAAQDGKQEHRIATACLARANVPSASQPGRYMAHFAGTAAP